MTEKTAEEVWGDEMAQRNKRLAVSNDLLANSSFDAAGWLERKGYSQTGGNAGLVYFEREWTESELRAREAAFDAAADKLK